MRTFIWVAFTIFAYGFDQQSNPHLRTSESGNNPSTYTGQSLTFIKRRAVAPILFPQLYKCVNESSAATRTPTKQQTRSQTGEDVWLLENIFGKNLDLLYGGTFVEIGALDGMSFSNTFLFESNYDWRGILVEGHPKNQRQLRRFVPHHRKNAAAFTVAICRFPPALQFDSSLVAQGAAVEGGAFGPLVTSTHPGSANFSFNTTSPTFNASLNTVHFTTKGGTVGAALELVQDEFLKAWHEGDHTVGDEVACMPMQDLIDETGLFDINLFSLDVEGAELLVLETIDFHVTNIQVLMVEMDGTNAIKDTAIRQLLRRHGFVEATSMGLKDIKVDCGYRACMRNEVFINPNFEAIKSSRPPPQLYHFGTGVRC